MAFLLDALKRKSSEARCFCIVHPESEQCQDISFSQTSIQVKLPCVGLLSYMCHL